MKQKSSRSRSIVLAAEILEVEDMTRRNPNAETIGHLAAKASFLLKTYHAECHRSAASRETEFWRGNISGFRYAIGEIYGHDVIHGVLLDVRKNTGLEVPPIGELDSEGKFLGVDPEADF
jgi:hypothetical protein